MSKKQFQIAFIGGGVNSAIGHTHRIASQMDSRWNVVAGCFSRNDDINKETSELFSIEPGRVYSNYQDLLDNEKGKLDAIVVLTPIPSHFNILKNAIENGYNVISEKALVLSVDEAIKIKDLTTKHKTFLAVTFNYTGYIMLRKLRDMINNGDLGKINQLNIEMPQESYIRQNSEMKTNQPQEWRREDYGVSCVSLDLAAHMANMSEFLVNSKPEKIVACEDSFGAFDGLVDNVNAISRYQDGMVCNMWFSKSAIGHRNGLRVRVYGEKASAEWYQLEPEYLKFYKADGTSEVIDRSQIPPKDSLAAYDRFKPGHPTGFIEAFANYYHDLADSLEKFLHDSISTESEFTFGVDDSIEGLKFLEAINKSAQSGGWENIN